MAHFARIDKDNIVTDVLVVSDEQQHRGQEFLADDLGLGGTWVQTSYNNNFRKQFAGMGYSYDPETDVFIAPSPFPSWVLNEAHDWVPPVERPSEGLWRWDEETTAWIQVDPGEIPLPPALDPEFRQ
jgi:hypothetical protein